LRTTTEETFAGAPDADGYEVRQPTVAPGSVGDADPDGDLRPDGRRRRLPGRADHGAARPGNDPYRHHGPGPFQLPPAELRADAPQHDYARWEQDNAERGRFDLSTSPAVTFRVFYAGARQPTLTFDLDGVEVAEPSPSLLSG